MALPNVQDVLQVPGRLSYNPTSLSLDYPHGGTALGIVRQISVRPAVAHQEIKAEEFGVETVDILYIGEAWVLTAILRSFDNDMLGVVWANTKTPGTSGKRTVEYPGTGASPVRAGSLVSNRSVKLVFTPDDTQHHPMLILYRALPMIQESTEISLALNLKFEIAVAFVGIRDASGRIVAFGMKEDLTL